jgi:hypothetical protein
MGAASFIPIVGSIIDKGLDVIDEFIEDKDKANELKAKLKDRILVQHHDEIIAKLESQTKIILAEVKGGWLQRNWRPLLMVTIVLIIFNNYVFVPYASIFTDKVTVLELPKGFWALMTVGVGGYIGGRSIEKVKGVSNSVIPDLKKLFDK